jgi:hypothetical protein
MTCGKFWQDLVCVREIRSSVYRMEHEYVHVQLYSYNCTILKASCAMEILTMRGKFYMTYEGGPKSNRNLNVARELEVVARCAARCHEPTQYSSSLSLGVDLG